MLRSAWLVCILITSAAPSLGKDIYLSIGGSVGVFRTDARIINPLSRSITVEAYYLPSGNVDNSAIRPVRLTIPKRQMRVYNDVVTSLFNASGIGAIRLSSTDDFLATQRIYAQTQAGTLGQFVPGLDAAGAARNRGIIAQLRSGSGFRTNVGAVNPNNLAATVVWRLYDRNNVLVATGAPVTMPPYAVIGPTNIAGTFFFNPGNADLSDAWVSFTSDRPIFAYASVIDSATTDPTFIPMAEDHGPVPPNATFDRDVDSWGVDSRFASFTTLTWNASDANGAAGSGSAQIRNSAATGGQTSYVVSECTPVVPSSPITLRGKARLPSGQSATGSAFLFTYWYADAECRTPASRIGDGPPAFALATESWVSSELTLDVPTDTRGALFGLVVTKNQPGATFGILFDDLALAVPSSGEAIPPAGGTVTDEQRRMIAEQLAGAVVQAFSSIRIASKVRGAKADAVVQVNNPIFVRVTCASGGRRELSGNVSGSIDEKGSGALVVDARYTYTDCDGLNGDPYLTLTGTFSFLNGAPATQQYFRVGGGVKPGCSRNSLTIILNTVSGNVSISGILCGNLVNF